MHYFNFTKFMITIRLCLDFAHEQRMRTIKGKYNETL